ncbi:MAG: DUF853 family protein [Euryarchaeota archaeon]|nr:DUF853 family protein [Euryarchaeota archaeon]
MAGPTRILGFNPKQAQHKVPWIPADWILTIDLDGVPRLYFDFWRTGLLGRERNGKIQQRAIEALSSDYVLHARPEAPPQTNLRYAYSCTYSNDRLPEACMTLLQLGIKTRLHLLVQDRGHLASFAVATERPVPHVLRQFFRDLEEITSQDFEAVAAGHTLRPKHLTRFTLPTLPGLLSAAPTVLPLESSTPPHGAAIQLGEILSPINGKPIGPAFLTLDALNHHVLVAGTTGAGKTNTVLRMIQETHGQVEGILVFDVKQEYRTLHASLNAKVYGFTGRNLLTHNLLKPSGPPAQWVKEFSSIFSEVINRYVPAVGSKDIVAETLDKLYRERGIYEDGVNYPHIGDLIEALEKRPTSGREAGWSSSALRVLRSLMIGTTRQAFCVREGIALEALLNGVTVVELDGLGDPAGSALLVSVLLQKIRDRLQREKTEGLRHLIVFEEAQHLLALGQESTSVLTTTCREIRYLGVGLVFVTQMPNEFSKHALANVNTTIIHKLIRPQDQHTAAALLRLNDDAEDAQARLGVGQALVRSDALNLVQIPEIQRPEVRDVDLSQTVPNPEERSPTHAERHEVEKRLTRLTPRDWAVFNAIAGSRAISPRAIRELLKRSQSAVRASLTRLINLGLVAYLEAKTNEGRPPSIYFLRPYGTDAYTMKAGRSPDRIHAAAADHKELVEEVTRILGVERIPDRHFDLLYAAEGHERAIEIETGANKNDQILINVTKSIELQGEAHFVAADDTTLNRILQITAKHSFDTRTMIAVNVTTLNEIRTGRWRAYTFETEKPQTT